MKNRLILETKKASEIKKVTFDFGAFMDQADTITLASITTTVYSGVTETPAITSGSATISGHTVIQLFTAGTAGTVYTIGCLATSSTGAKNLVEARLAVL